MNQKQNRLSKKLWSLLLLATFSFSILSPTASARLIFTTEDDGVESDVYTLDVDGTVNLTDNTDLSLNFGANLGASITYNDSTGDFTFNKDVNLDGNELKDVVIEKLAADPVACTAPVEGRVYYNTTSDSLLVCDGTAWVSTDTSALADGNVFVGNASGVATGVALSGDATISNTGVLSLAADSVDSAEIADDAVGSTEIATDAVDSDEIAADAVGDSEIDYSAVTLSDFTNDLSLTDTQVFVGNGSNVATGVTLSGDATISNTGAVTIADDAVDASDIDSAGAGNSKVLTTDGTGATAWVDQTTFATSTLTSGNIFVGNGSNEATSVTASGDVTVDNTGAFSLAADSVDSAEIADDAVGDSEIDYSAVTLSDFTNDLSLTDTQVFVGNGSNVATGVTLSGDATISNTGAVTIADDAVDASDIDSAGAGNSKVLTTDGTGATAWVDQTTFATSTLTSGNIFVGNGSNEATSVTASGDVTVDNTGAFSLAADSVDSAEIADDAVGDSEIDYSAVTLSDFTNDLGLADTNIFVGNGSGVATAVAVSGDATIDNAGALSLAADSVDSAEIVDDAVGSTELADDAVDTAAIQNNAVDGTKLGIGTTAGDTLFYDGTDWVRLGIGTAGQVLATNGTTDAPEWIDNTGDAVDVSVAMPPEFPNFTITADGTNNRGTLESDYDGTNNRNYYQWTTRRGAMQDYDLVVQWPIPEDFEAWQSAPISFDYRTNTATDTDNQIDLTSILDTAGVAATLAGDTTDLAAAAWTTANVTGPEAGGTYTAGEFITITFKLQSTNGGDFAQLGAMQFNYTAK